MSTIFIGAVAGVFSSAEAATQTWSGTNSGVWDLSELNWDSGTAAWTNSNDALFSGTPTNNVTTATGLTIGTITLDNTFTGSVTMTGGNTVSGATTISGGTLNLNAATGLGASAITVNSGGTLAINPGTGNSTVNNNISGAGLVTAQDPAGAGGNTLQLGGIYSGFTGTLNILAGASNFGKVNFSNTTQASVMSSSATIQVQSGATLYLNKTNLNYGAKVELFGAGNSENLGALRLENDVIQSGSVTLKGNSVIGVNGGTDGTISGAIGESGGSFGFTKVGNRTLNLTGSNSYTGATTINAGTLSASSLADGGSNSSIGASSNAASNLILNGGTLQYTGAAVSTDRLFSLQASSSINASGTGAVNFTNTGSMDFNGGTAAKTLTLTGTNTGANTIAAIIGDNTGATSLTKSGVGSWTLTGANTYTGTTTIQGGTLNVGNGTSGSLGTTALTFSGTGTINFNEAAGSSQSMGLLTVNAGAAATVRSTYGGSGNTSLTFSDVVARNAGSTANFVVSGGTNGTTNKIVFTQVAGGAPSTGTLLDKGYFYNGSSYAAYDSGGFVRAYGSGDTNYVTAAGSNSIANTATNNVALTGNVTSQASAAINTLNMGANTLALDTGAAFQTDGILVSGNSASTISGGASLAATTNGAELVVRVDGSSDALTISTPIIANGTNAFTKTGAGTLTLSGSNSYTGATTISNGTLQIGNGGTTGSLSTSSTITNHGNLIFNRSNAIAQGTDFSTAAIGGTGSVTQAGGGTLTLNAANTYTGGTNINAGTVSATVANALGTTGTVTVGSSGTLNLSTGNTTYGFASLSGSGVVNATVGTGSQGTTFKGGTGFTGTINIGTGAAAGAGKVNITNATLGAGSTINVATNATLYYAQANTLPSNITLGGGDTGESLGQLRLENGATVSGNVTLTGDITGAGDSTVGGNGSTGTISGNIGESNGSHGLSKGGNGTIVLSGTNTYTGATTIGAGTLRLANSLALQNSTLSYTSAAALVFDSTVATHAFTLGGLTGTSNIALADNGSNAVALTVGNNNTSPGAYSGILSGGGSLRKIGTGTLTLSGGNSFTGATTVNGGTLVVSGTGGINGSSGVTINGSTAKLVQTSSTAGIVPITLTQGTLDGTGTVGAVTVGNGTGGIVTNGNGGTSALTMDSLTFNGAGTISLNKASDISTVGLAVTGAFTTTAANGQITLNVLTAPAWVNGSTYNLISYGSFNGANTDFTLGTITGLGARQSATLGNTGASSGFITLAIAGDTPVWTGAANGNWTTTAQPSPFNWKLQTAGTTTQFLTNDQVLFDDTATGTTEIKITDANVSPASVIFNNSLKNYSVSSDTGLGIASGTLSKSGTGSLTLNTANTYSGGTTLNGGTLNVNNASAIGTGSLTIAAGTTIDNTSASAVTLSTNNTQFWNGDFTFGGTNDLNLGTGAVTLATTLHLTTNGTKTLTVGGAISGPPGAGLVKEGTGTLALNGANTFDGGVAINAGVVRLGNAAALGASTNSLTFGASSNAKLQVNGNAATVGSLDGDNTTTIENSNATNGSLTVGSGSFDGILQNGSAGTLTLAKTGPGILTLTGANTYSGGTTVNGGTLSVGGNNALGTGTVTMSGGNLSNTTGVTLANNFTLNNAATFTASGGDMVLSGNITGSPAGNWTLTPTNKITLAGTNSLTSSAGLLIGAGSVDITGSTTIDGGANTNAGFATIGNGADATLTILNGGSLAINGTTGGIKPNTIIGQNLSNSTINVGATDKSSSGTLTIGGNTGFVLGNNNAASTGVMTISSGTATITAGSATLQNVQNFIAMGRDNATGIINLDGGTLATGRQFVRDGSAGGTEGTGTAIVNFNGGVLRAQANQIQGNGWFETATTGNFQVVTTNVAEGGAKIDTNGFNVNINTALVHAGSNVIDGGLVKSGAGTLSLGGTNTFTGNAIVNEGTLALATNVSLDDTIVLSLAGGTTLDLAFASDSETVFGLVLNGTAVAAGTYDATQLNALGAGSSISFTSAGGTLTVLSAVPEPGTVALVSLGLLIGLFVFRRSKTPMIS
ncbi:MAG TPA: autotransporter-associated beta strand repeat-containing protein [Lacunisphaera sp.]